MRVAPRTKLIRCVVCALAAALGLFAAATPGRSRVAGHLYVSDAFGGQVVSYPLHLSGRPERQPDLVLPGLQGPFGLAAGADGSLYVSESEAEDVALYVPANGSIDRAGTLNVPHSPTYLALDARGYLYVCIDNTYTLVYPPKARGNALPIGRIPTREPQGLVAAHNDLFVLETASGIDVYNRPWRAPQRPDVTLRPDPEENLFAEAMAQDEIGRTYVHFVPEIDRPWTQMDFARKLWPLGARDDLFLTQNCKRGRDEGITYGAAARFGNLYIGCNTPSAAVFVYDARSGGRHEPVAKLTWPLHSVQTMVIGP